MSRYTIVALVPEPYATELNRMRKQYDTFCRQWLPPHVTIVPPFDLALTREEKSRLKQLSIPTKAVFDGWGEFRRKFTSVLFQKLPDHTFDDMKVAIYDAVPALPKTPVEDASYHVTVVSRIPNEAYEPLMTEVTSQDITGEFSVDHVTLYQWDDTVRRWLEVT